MQLISSNSTIDDDFDGNYHEKIVFDQEVLNDRLRFIPLFGNKSPQLSVYDNQSVAEENFQPEEIFDQPEYWNESMSISQKKIKKNKCQRKYNDSKLLSEEEFIEVCRKIEQCQQIQQFLSEVGLMVSKLKSQVMNRKTWPVQKK